MQYSNIHSLFFALLLFFPLSLSQIGILTYERIKYSSTDFDMIKIEDSINLEFGDTFIFSPLGALCNSYFEKERAKECLKYRPNNWDCIYDICVSPSEIAHVYVNIKLLMKYSQVMKTIQPQYVPLKKLKI